MGFLPVEELRVFQLAEKVADSVWDIVTTSDYFTQDTVGKQLVRAASLNAYLASIGKAKIPNTKHQTPNT
jgi:hypothetical protein